MALHIQTTFNLNCNIRITQTQQVILLIKIALRAVISGEIKEYAIAFDDFPYTNVQLHIIDNFCVQCTIYGHHKLPKHVLDIILFCT